MGIYLVRMAIKKRVQKTKLQAINEELTSLGIDPIADTDQCPERTRFLRHIQSPDFDDKDWVKTYKSLKEQYALAFHTYFAVQFPCMLFEYGEDKVYWDYDSDKGIYHEMTGSVVRGIVINLLISEGLNDKANESFAKDVLARFRAICPHRGKTLEDFDSESDWFHVNNGWVNIVNGEFRQHTPEFLSKRKSVVDYSVDAQCPIYNRFLDKDIMVPPDAVRVMDQFAGLLLTHDTQYEKMLTLIGRPGSGKSTLMNIWSHVLGDFAVQKRLSEITGDAARFGGADLVGKTLCWFDEVDVKRSEMGNSLGLLVSGKKIRVERKGINGIYDTTNGVKCVLTANNLPLSAEHGIYRRLLFINFPRSFHDEGSVNPHLYEELIEEGSGILNRMIKGLQDLRKMRGFTVIDGHDELIEEYKAESDTVAEFLDTYFEPDYEHKTVILNKTMFIAYKAFLGDHRQFQLTPDRFGRLLLSQPLNKFAKIKKVRVHDGRGWTGFTLKKQYEITIDETIVERAGIDF